MAAAETGLVEEVRAAEAKVLAATATVEVMGWAAVAKVAARATVVEAGSEGSRTPRARRSCGH